MVVVSFILVLIIFLDLNVYIYADPKFCKSKPKGNTDCIYKCHCLNDAPCDETNGSCGDQSYCSPGWIGPGCQYSNLAYTSRDNSNQNYIVNDGNYRSCSKHYRFTIKLQRAYHISSFTVFAYDGISKMVKRALVTNSTTEDISIINTCIENTTMLKKKDFICTHTIFGRFLILEFENNADICEIGIHGGKNIALWKSTNQSSTLVNFSSNKAVDGNIGNYEISSDSCAHTSADSSQIKPYWEVVFAKAFLIQKIVIFFRDEFSYPVILKRSSNYSLSLINNGNVVKSIETVGKPNRTEEIVLQQPVLVTSVKIGLPNKPSEESVLSLCEVEVFACRLGPDGDVCSNSCPIYCNPRNNQSSCTNFTCPENSCAKPWHNAYCSQKECSKNDLKLMKLKINETSCLSSLCLSGQKINVQCVEGYTVKGSGYVMCGKDGNWSFDTTCKANTCLLPNDVHTHTNVTGQSNVKFGTAIIIACDSGYHVKSSIDRCQLNGTWSSTGLITAPLCIENTCSLPTNDEHARINQTAGKEFVRIGTSVKIKCDIGYRLKIPEEVFCQLNGTWNFNWDRLLPVCEENTCDLPKDKHALVNLTNVNGKVSFGKTIKIFCDKEYKVNGPSVTHCQPNGTWTPGWNESEALCEGTDGDLLSSVSLGVGIGITVFVVVLIITGTILFRIRRKKKQNQKNNTNVYDGFCEMNETNVYCTIQEGVDEYETVLANDKTNGEQNSGYYAFQPHKTISKNAIKVEHFINYVEENNGEDGSIVSQFSKLSAVPQLKSTVGCLQQNKGYDSVKRYVASQGPSNRTQEDFWKMVYQLGSDKIVMLTNVFEEGEHVCVQYWPDEEHVKYGTMSVHLKTVDEYANFTLRVISIRKDEKEWHNVRHFHLTSWPDIIIQKNAASLLQFRHTVMNMPSKGNGPIIVHCSAGIGRTGVFIALDILVSQARLTGQVDVYTCVETLRRQRVNMVETIDQYLLLHYLLKEELMCGNTAKDIV